MTWKLLSTAALLFLASAAPAVAEQMKAREGKILIIASNVLDTGGPDPVEAKNNLWEVAPPYHVFAMNGFEVDFASPKGGRVPFLLDVDDVDPPGMISYTIKYERFREKADQSLAPAHINATEYVGVFIGGGFGPLFDVAVDQRLLAVIARIYERGGVVGACGHGPGSLSDVRLADGTYLVKGKKITGFPNSSEKVSKRSKQGALLPFLVEDGLRGRGAIFQTKAELADKNDVVVDGRLVTTMFLPSCAIAAKEMVDLLKKWPISASSQSVSDIPERPPI